MSAISPVRALLLSFTSLFLSSAAGAQDLHFYLRCNSTSLNVDGDSRMKVSAASPRVATIVFETSVLNEDCTLTETNGLDQEGQIIFDYNLNFRGLLANGEQTWIGNASPRPAFFRIDYEETGFHTASIDLDTRNIFLVKSETPGPDPVEDSFFYLLCNTTGWLVAENNRFKPDLGGFLSVVVNVPRQNFSEECTLSETDAKNDWGDWTIDYDLTGRTVFEGFSFGIGESAPRPSRFKIEYKRAGLRKIWMNPENRRIWIGS